MTNVGYATLQIIPSALGFRKNLNAQIGAGMAAQGQLAGKQAAKGTAAGMAASGGLVARGAKVMAKGGAAGIAALGYGVLNASGDFEAAMNQVKAVSGATGSDFEALRDQAKDLGSSTKFSASEAASGMDFLARAGFKSKQIIGAMPGTLNLAAAANLGLGQSADIVSNVLTGYGLKTKQLGRANDVLVKTFTSTNTDLGQLGEAFKYVGPVAKSAGVSFESTSAAIGLLGNAGIQGSMAGTALRSSITRMLNPVGQAKDAIKDLGLKTTDAEGNFVGFESIVGQLERKGASTAQIMALFGQRAGPAMQALVDQGSGALRRQRQSLEDVGNITDRVANQQMKGLKGGLTELKSAFEGLFIALGDTGVLDAADTVIRSITSGVQSLTGAISGANGPAGKFGSTLDAIRSFALPLFDTLKSIGQDAMAVLKPAFAEISSIFTDQVLPAFEAFLPAVQPIANFLLNVIGSAVVGALKGAMNVIKGVLKTIAGVFNVFAGLLTGDWSRLWNGIKQIVSGVFTAIKGAIQVLWNVGILGIFRKGAALVKGLFSGLWKRIVGLVKGGFARVKAFVQAGWNFVKSLFSKGVSKAFSLVRSGFSKIVSTVRSTIGNVRSFIGSAWSTIRSKIASAASAILSKIRSAFGSVLTTVRNKIGDAVDFVRGLPGKAVSALAGIGSKLIDKGRSLIGGFITGIKEKAGEIVGAVTGPISGAVDKVKGLLKINSPSKVFRDLGRGTGEGMALGIRQSAKGVSKAAEALAYVPDASGKRGGAGAYAGGRRSVVENLTLQSSGNVRDDLDEVMFNIRRIDRGGAYA